MNQHRALRFPSESIFSNVHKVHPDLFDAGFVVRIFRRHDNLAAVFEQVEMMRSRIMREAHHVVAALNNAVLTSALVRLAVKTVRAASRNKRVVFRMLLPTPGWG